MGRKYSLPIRFGGLEERCEFSQRGRERRPGQKRFCCNLISADRLCWQQTTTNYSPFYPEKWGIGTPRTPVNYAYGDMRIFNVLCKNDEQLQWFTALLLPVCCRSSRPASADAQREKSKSCYQLAVFKEPETAAVRTLINCEGGHRLSHAYLSESSVVDVEFFVSRNQLKNQLYFLLHYTGEPLYISLPVSVIKSKGAVVLHSTHLPFPGHWAHRWLYHWVCDAWSVRRQKILLNQT